MTPSRQVPVVQGIEPASSWVITCDNGGKAFETFNLTTAERAARAGWRVEAIHKHLPRINREIRGAA